MIAYENPAAAIDWLTTAFGFREVGRRHVEPDGRVSHAEMDVGGQKIMLANPTPDYESPRHHRDGCEASRRWSSVPWVVDGLLVYVSDVGAHFLTAKAAGATLLSALEDDGPGRRYRAEDLEGHRWMFMERPGPAAD